MFKSQYKNYAMLKNDNQYVNVSNKNRFADINAILYLLLTLKCCIISTINFQTKE